MLNVLLPFSEDKTAMILFHLDMKGIAVSEGAPARVVV
jgi:cysteine desulfurase